MSTGGNRATDHRAAGSKKRASSGSAVRTHQEVFRLTAVRVGLVGGALAALGLAAGHLAGGRAWVGAAWGAGAGARLTAITAAVLAAPWDRVPRLGSSGAMLSFIGKIIVMIGVVVLARPYKSAMSPVWFLGTLAAVLLGVAAIEIVSLANRRSLTVDSRSDDG